MLSYGSFPPKISSSKKILFRNIRNFVCIIITEDFIDGVFLMHSMMFNVPLILISNVSLGSCMSLSPMVELLNEI